MHCWVSYFSWNFLKSRKIQTNPNFNISKRHFGITHALSINLGFSVILLRNVTGLDEQREHFITKNVVGHKY